MSIKIILTKTQAISLLTSIDRDGTTDMFLEISVDHPFYTLSCEEIEKKVYERVNESQIAGVVDDEKTIILENEKTRSFNR